LHVPSDIARAIEGLLIKDEGRRMPLTSAIAVSDAVAALVADVPSRLDELDDCVLSTPVSSATFVGNFAAESPTAFCASHALIAAREALSKDVDDPEELVQALTMLEQEQAGGINASAFDVDGFSSALQAVESELRIRIAALRIDAAALLDDLLVVTDVAEESSHNNVVAPVELEEVGHDGLIVRGTAAAAAEARDEASDVATALEVATTLGVDTEPSEQRIACKRGMLSLRVVWGKVARFCMLPVNVGFESLAAEVSRRFGMPLGVPLPQLCWREAGEMFKLNSQASWEECLQRRGLVAQPGRLELCVDSEDAPPLPMQLRATVRKPVQGAYRPELFTWRAPDKVGRRACGQQREFCARSPSAAMGHRELISRSPHPLVDAALTNADESRRQLHAAAVKVQSLFRGSRVRRQAQEGHAEVEAEDSPRRMTGYQRRKAFTNMQHRGFTTGFDFKNATDAHAQHFGQTSDSSVAARLQSRHARRTTSRCQGGFLGIEGSTRDRRSMSPKVKSPPNHARQQMFDVGIGSRGKSPPNHARQQMLDVGTGSRLQVNGKCAPRR
jgi:hypothetical protein